MSLDSWITAIERLPELATHAATLMPPYAAMSDSTEIECIGVRAASRLRREHCHAVYYHIDAAELRHIDIIARVTKATAVTPSDATPPHYRQALYWLIRHYEATIRAIELRRLSCLLLYIQ